MATSALHPGQNRNFHHLRGRYRRNVRGQKLVQIPGMMPSPLGLPPGCAFRTRCPRADAACLVEPALAIPHPGRAVRCVHPHLVDVVA